MSLERHLLFTLYHLYRWLHWPIRRSWWLALAWYRLFGIRLAGGPDDPVWYFAFGANMHPEVFCGRRGMSAQESRVGCLRDYRLRFNVPGLPRGRAAPANIEARTGDEVWGVLYKITQRELVWLDHTEAVPVWRYTHLWTCAEDADGRAVTPVVAYIARGGETDGRPSRRYITLLREGARRHGLPAHWIHFLDDVRCADETG